MEEEALSNISSDLTWGGSKRLPVQYSDEEGSTSLPRMSPPLILEQPTPVTRALDSLEENMLGIINDFQQRVDNLTGQNQDDSNDVVEVEIDSQESSLTPARQRPVPSPRKHLTGQAERPIPAERTSLKSKSNSHQSSHTGILPVDQQSNPPWENPQLSPDIQEMLRQAYISGRKDGSAFGSRTGSIAETVSATTKVRQYLSSTVNDSAGVIIEEAEGHLDAAAATVSNPVDVAELIRNFSISETDSMDSKRKAARREALDTQRLRKEACIAYNYQKGKVTRLVNQFLANAENEDYDIKDLNFCSLHVIHNE